MSKYTEIINAKKATGKELHINIKLDLVNRYILNSEISMNDFKELFDLKGRVNFSDTKPQNLILYSKDKKYYCHNCIFGHVFNENGMVSIYANSIDYILENGDVKKEKIISNKVVVELEVPLDFNNINYVSDFTFEYNTVTKVEIKKTINKENKIVSIIVTNKRNIKAKKLMNIAFVVYELLIMYCGTGMKFISRKYINNNNEILFHSSIVNKYSCVNKSRMQSKIIIQVDKHSINSQIIKKWLELKDKTSLLIDIYFSIINSDIYNEIKINMLVQCIEGFYKSCINDSLKLWEILEEVFLKNKNTGFILSRTDKRKIKVEKRMECIFLYKAKNHRNYFSHLNKHEKKNLFEKKQMNYAFWKINLCFRTIIIDYIGLTVDNKLKTQVIGEIEQFKKKFKIIL